MSLVQNPELLIKVIIIITVLTTENDNSLSAKKKQQPIMLSIYNFFSDTIGKGLMVTVNVTNGAYNNDFW